MARNEKLLKKLEDRYEKGEISEEIYLELKEGLLEEEEKTVSSGSGERSSKISISGAGKLSGPIYTEKLSVSGSGKVDGDVDSNAIKASGALKIDGNVKAEDIGSSGSIKITGNVITDSFRNSGAAKVMGDLTAAELKSSGATKIDGRLKVSDMIRSSGTLHAKSIDAKEVVISGAFDVTEHIKAEDIRVKIAGRCTAELVEGDDIEIKPGTTHSFLGLSLTIGSSSKEAKIGTIKGKDVRLENVRAKEVIGNSVEIGPDCVIDVLKAKSVRVHEDAKVKKRVKLN